MGPVRRQELIIAAALACSGCGSSEAATSGTSTSGTSGAAGTEGTAGAGTSGTSGVAGATAGGGAGDTGGSGAGEGGATVDASSERAVESSDAAVDATGSGELVVTPSELVFSGVQNTKSAPQSVSFKNTSTTSVAIDSVALDATAQGSASFELVSAPKAGSSLAAGDAAAIDVLFHPTAVGVFAGSIVVKTAMPSVTKSVSLYGLGAKGLEGENEPPLKLVVETLGFAIDVGGATLALGTGAAPIGDEVPAFRFKASGAMPVEMIPVARYSPQELVPYGYYTAAGEVVIGTEPADQNQTLYPTTQPGSKTSFVAPAGEFGIFAQSMTHKTYTEDSKNAGNQTRHAVRTYPLKNRQGMAIANAYLLCMEEAANGDYQDYVFELANVVPIAQ
jgi:hypothetical protein